MATRTSTAADWLQPVPEQQGLKRYLETLRERIWIVVACVVLALAAAIVYVVTADRVYEAQANLLITPVPAENATFVTLGLLRESNDPSREVETATQLVNTHAVAERVSTKLGGDRSPDELLGNVEATPVAQSNIVAVIAKSGSAAGAAELANAFAEQAIAQTTDELHARIDGVLPELRDQVASLPADEPTAQELSAELVQLEILRAGVDPTMTLETPATEPSHPSSPKVVLTLAGAASLGLLLGLAAAFALRVLDPRLRREEQLGELFRLPVLARIPAGTESRPRAADARRPLGASDRGLSDPARDADRRTSSGAAHDPGHRSVRGRREDDHRASPRRVAGCRPAKG